MPTLEEVKKELREAIEAAQNHATDADMANDCCPEWGDMLDRLCEIEGAFYSLCEATA